MSVNSVSIRLTTLADVSFVLQAESASDNAPFVGQWTRAQHEAAIASANQAHFIIKRGDHPIGYIILIGLSDPHSTLNLRRIVITQKGSGYGRQALRWIKAYAFDTLGIHRLWFDVIASNHRAQALYKSEGFIVEGILRDSWKTTGGYEDMLILSMLENEYRARQSSNLA